MKILRQVFQPKPKPRSRIHCEHCGRDEFSMLPVECYGVCHCGRIVKSSFPQVQPTPGIV